LPNYVKPNIISNILKINANILLKKTILSDIIRHILLEIIMRQDNKTLIISTI